ncbi:MAG TPA: hypothetical protein VL404_06670 [Candidatus Eisenbacteria bacterium]|jgi:hypothetical protein|nr:hypothetical protein [Candidatus Eisenbacteria bacterium]
MRKLAFVLVVFAALIVSQSAAFADAGQSGTKGTCKTNFAPGNKHAK